MPVGDFQAANVGIVAFTVRRHMSGSSLLQAFARVANFGRREASVSVELWNRRLQPEGPQLVIPSGFGFEGVLPGDDLAARDSSDPPQSFPGVRTERPFTRSQAIGEL